MKHKIALLIVASIGVITHVNISAMDTDTDRRTETELVLESQDPAALAQLFANNKTNPLSALRVLAYSKPDRGKLLEDKINYIINQYQSKNIHPQLTNTQYVWQLIYNYGPSKTPNLAAWIRWFIDHGPKDNIGRPIIEQPFTSPFSAIDKAIWYNLAEVVEILLAYQQPTDAAIDHAQREQLTAILALLPQKKSHQETISNLIKQMVDKMDGLGEGLSEHEIKKIASQTEPAVLAAYVNNFFNTFSNNYLSDQKLDRMIDTPNFIMVFDTIFNYIQNNNIAYNADIRAVIKFIDCSVERAYNNTWEPKDFNLYKNTYTKWLRFLVGYGLKGRINSPIEQLQSSDIDYTLQNCTILDYTIVLFRFINPFMNQELAAETITILKGYGADPQRPFTLLHYIRRDTGRGDGSFKTITTSYNTTSTAIINDFHSERRLFNHLGFNNPEPMNRALEKAINSPSHNRFGSYAVLKAAVASMSVYAFYYWLKNRWSSTQATINDDVLINNTDADIIITYLQESDSAQSTSTTIAPGKRAQLAQTGTLHIYRNTTEKPLIINLDTYATNRTEHYLNIGISKNWLSWLFGPLRYTIHWVDKDITE